MGLALEQAEKARALGEVPVGCVVVRNGEVIGAGYNRRETDKTVLGHAELMAMKQAEQAIGDWRLSDCTLSRWSPAPCVPVPFSTHGWERWCAVPLT